MSGTDHPALYSRYLSTAKPHWINGVPAGLKPHIPLDCCFRYQHSQPLIKCRLSLRPDDQLDVEIAEPKRAIAVGQYAVFYLGDVCLGSASVTSVGPTEYQLQQMQSNQNTAADGPTEYHLQQVRSNQNTAATGMAASA